MLGSFAQEEPGRYRLWRRKQLVEEYFGAAPQECEWSPRYNITPTQPVLAIRQESREPVRTLSTMRWGLPHMRKIMADRMSVLLGQQLIAIRLVTGAGGRRS